MSDKDTPARRWAWRTALASTAAVIAVAALMLMAGPAAAETTHFEAIKNPLDGITPDLSMLGPALNSKWTKLAAAVWAVTLAVLSLRFITATVNIKSKRGAGYAGDLASGKEDQLAAGYALGICAMAAPIIGGILYIAG